jgi:ATP-dependent Clp protease ATP-binding subunit ClpX
MIPELIGRFPMKTFTKELSEAELVYVLSNTKNNILNDYKFYFNVDEIALEFTQDFMERIASQAKIEKTGVRGLKAICDSIMMPHQYLIPEYKKRNVAKITFFGECVDKKQVPKIEIFEKKKVAKKS